MKIISQIGRLERIDLLFSGEVAVILSIKEISSHPGIGSARRASMSLILSITVLTTSNTEIDFKQVKIQQASD
jgi:hypothetical protein